MDIVVFKIVNKSKNKVLNTLSNHFNIDINSCKEIINSDKNWNLNQKINCQARIWNGGLGGQCSKKQTNGSDFCIQHSALQPNNGWCKGCFNDYGYTIKHKYVWEHNGSINDPEPKWMIDARNKRIAMRNKIN